MHDNNPLGKEVPDLLPDPRLHVNDMREFLAKNVRHFIAHNTNPMAHYKAALRLFGRWCSNLRKTIRTSGAKYALIGEGCSPKEAEKESITMYRTAYRNIDRNRREETNNED